MKEIERFENKIELFVKRNALEPADAIMVKKMPLKLVNHYIIYLGINKGFHIFMANTSSGIKLYNYYDLMKNLKIFIPEKIEKFIGTYTERKEAVIRALSRANENSYNLILNNCEHLKNWIQKGKHKSYQVENVGKMAVGIGSTIAIASKSKGGLYTGLGLMLVGGLAWALSGDDNNIPKFQYSPTKKDIDKSTKR